MKERLKYIYQFLMSIFSVSDDAYQPGLSALICCKDEEHNITACLTSISEFADQIICVDNGSTDDTYALMKAFKNSHKNLQIVLINAGDLLLKDARNKGLAQVNHKWLLHSGGDFVFYTKEAHPFRKLLSRILQANGYSAWRLKHVNLYGDLHHTYKTMNTINHGEHYLIRMHKSIKFVEEGKFDYLKLPWYYHSRKTDHACFFHLDGLKSDMRLLYRNAYFEWRQLVNQNQQKLSNLPFDDFFECWKLELFGTTDAKKLKYRFQKQLAKLHCMKYEEKAFCEYPFIIQKLIEKGNERFQVHYQNGLAVGRKDTHDLEMENYQPEGDDLSWDVAKYEAKYAAKHYLRDIKSKLIPNVGSEK